MNEAKLSDAQWEVIKPLLPPQPRTGRRRQHDREVLNSMVYRLVAGSRYRDLPRTAEYAARTTTYHWLKEWAEAGVLERIWQELLSLLERDGKLDLSKGSLDGSFVPAKRGARPSTTDARAKAQR
jgi:transposase